jgi:hypothetical protein
MSYIPYKSDWFYSPIDIPNLEQIQKEFVDLFWTKLGDKVPEGSSFLILDDDRSGYPAFIEYINAHGLENKWYTVGFSVTNNKAEFPVHVDYVEGQERYISLNIPIINCLNSYIVWYEAELSEMGRISIYKDSIHNIVFPDDDSTDTYEANGAFWCKNPSELLRVECAEPMLIHVGRPHRPIVEHNELRVLVTVRFRPELTNENLLNLGFDNPSVII